MNTNTFRETVWGKGREFFRDMPWREDTRPYYVLVSELMLQQTQVDRVIPKFNEFVKAFPDEQALAQASLADVLKCWQGLGHNRRAKFLHDGLKMIVGEFGGKFPETKQELLKLPGVGVNTAGAILVYSFNQPITFIETNVRTVYFHHFFKDGQIVDDKELLVIVEKTADNENPREWHWALMDYGSWLKRNGHAKLQQSKHYKKQSALKGSVREIRGHIITLLSKQDRNLEELRIALKADDRFNGALHGLILDGLVTQTNNILHLTK